MARKQIDVGVVGNDGTGDSIRDSFRKVNDNFRELYSSLGLGEKLTFIGLDDSPVSYVGQNDPETGLTPLVTVNNTESGVTFKSLKGGTGITIDYTTNENEITLNSAFSSISSDTFPALGGSLNAFFGGKIHPIGNLPDLRVQAEVIDAREQLSADHNESASTAVRLAANKGYVDGKISLGGATAIDPATGLVSSAFGRMGGPLILSRDPEPDDDVNYNGLVAATKRYVDNSSFGSVANLYVATSGQDARVGVSKALQGRALAYAYKTLEAALRRAEELVLESKLEIGPYKKLLTYDNGVNTCTLSSIETSPESGSGFAGEVRMSVDTLVINSVGTNYFVGDILTVTGGAIPVGGAAATIEVLSTLTTPGAISTFRIISTGVYSGLPGAVGNATTISTSAAPAGISAIGAGATFNITYKVNSISITNVGSGYSLVSVRIAGGSGAGAFGTAVVSGGTISSVTITDQGSGFTTLPSLEVNLPRFAIFTDGQRTDFTGDVTTNTPQAIRGRDIREGLFLRGENSGALAQILAHDGSLDSLGNELFDVDIKVGAFEIDEPVAYGDVTKSIQITILVESGVYEENYPLKVPQNVSIVGNEFRRCIVRPRIGTSSSPWAFRKFRRDLVIDGLTTAVDSPFGYHYLQDPSQPVYPKINNPGDYIAASALIQLNRSFMQEEVSGWIANQIANNVAPFTTAFEYDVNLCKRDIGLIIDALTFDLEYGDYNRTISAGLKYYQSASARIAITTQLSETLASIDHLNELIQQVITNTAVATTYQLLYPQTIDRAFAAEINADTVITDLITAIKDVMDGSGSVNYPKENNQMDVFLANDACRWQAITAQGHGGFMLVLDPEGQVQAKSPYAQECASFSQSTNRQVFAGGKFVDGFTGNLQFDHDASDATFTRLTVSGLERLPKLPASFLVDDSVFRINYVRDFVYSTAGSTATFVLDETTPFIRAAGGQTCTISNGDPAVITVVEHRLQPGATIIFSVSAGGGLPAGIIADKEYYVVADGLTNNTFNITATFGSIVKVATTSSGTGTFAYQRKYELLMPGNRSMLSNDFTQINDLGYGLVATNGGLIEAVSMFTYYCHISYYSINGGQIRSVGGSSAHGNYALVAEGADPLEVPTPTTVYEEFSQRAKCYFPSATYANTIDGLFIFVYGYEYTPLGSSELEIDHGGIIYRYPVSNVTTADLPAGVARLNIGGGGGVTIGGLFAQVPNDTVLTIRNNGQILLTGDLAEVAVRPSTGLKLRETEDNVYRVLQFTQYADSNAPYDVSVTVADPAVFKILLTITDIATNLCTTSGNHKLRVGDVVIPTSSSNGLLADTTYYVIGVPEYNQFYLSLTVDGASPTLGDGSSLYIQAAKSHKLVENYTLQLSNPVLRNVIITGTAGQFSCSATTLVVGNSITINGFNSGTGSIAGFVNEVVYYIIATNGTTTFTLSASPGGSAITTTAGTPVGLTYTGVLPTPLTNDNQFYWVLTDGLTETEFKVATLKNGTPVAVTALGSGTFGYELYGLTRTTTRENYNYNDLTIYQPGDFTDDYPTGRTCTISIAAPSVISLVAHGFVAGDVIKFESTGVLPTGVTSNNNFHVISAGLTTDQFQISFSPGGDAQDTSGTQSGTQTVGKVTGQVGNLTFAVIPVAAQERSRVAGSKFVFLGEEYIIDNYQSEAVTNKSYARLVLSRPLVDSLVAYQNSYTIKSAVAIRTNGAIGSLTIRISLTRVTSHDLLEIGTGSYADTNYPSEIYGASVNAVNASQETDERDVGRCFYVTTDQFGNFSVGPFFRVDQGTGTVTFAASIALSNLDGIGFKRGVPVSEFSTDSGFTDNATDSVPTENAARIYIERRLGITHDGGTVTASQLIPTVSGGFMSLDGQLGMKGPMNLNNNKITNLIDPVNPQDAVNLQSLTFANFQNTVITTPTTGQLLSFTGSGDAAINVTITGDVTATRTSSDLNIQINSDTIINSDVKSDAAIVQSKLAMTAASARVNATGIVQADLGLASFDSAQFTATDGWLTVKDNGLVITKIAQIATKTVLGNSGLNTANVSAVTFANVIDLGLAVKKNQYSGTGILRRTNGSSSSSDGDYVMIEAAAGSSASVEASKLIARDSNGDFGGRNIDISQVKVDTNLSIDGATTATGGYLRYYGYDSGGGILISNGSLATDKTTNYWNDSHIFKTQNGVSFAPITVSSIQTTAITTGSNTDSGTITGRWTLTGTSPNESRLQSTYSADLAEFYEGDKDYEVGTVLVFGGDKEVTITDKQGDPRVAGVVSDTAAFVMYDACPGFKNLVALQGRVPCRVVGKIKKGDMLVTSRISGVAVAAGSDVKVGTVVGKALVEYDSDHIGTIEIAVGRT